MYKKTITFKNLDGEPITRDFYFNLSVDEAIEVEVEYGNDGLEGHMKKVLAANDNKELYQIFRRLIAKSYGERHEDGIQFLKSKKLSRKFMRSDAFSEFILELSVDEKVAAKFFQDIIPTEAVERMQKMRKKKELDEGDNRSKSPSSEKTFHDYSREELMAMSDEEFDRLMPLNPGSMTRPQLMIAMERKNRV